MLENGLIIALLLAIVVGVVAYLIRAKKRGQTCVGCPSSAAADATAPAAIRMSSKRPLEDRHKKQRQRSSLPLFFLLCGDQMPRSAFQALTLSFARRLMSSLV